ncbi:MAG: PAS domain S-box protein [Lentimicrobium sp.]|nr:PAS domain S-box protein [Lentimicrobium sp.]
MKSENERITQLNERINQLEAEIMRLKSPSLNVFSGIDYSVFSHLIETIGDFIVITDEIGKIRYVNSAVVQRFGYTRSELVGNNAGIFLEPAIRRELGNEILLQTRNGAWQGELNNITKSGEIFRVMLQTSGFKTNEGDFFLISISHDISRRFEAEQSLLYEREMLQNLMDSMPDSIYFKDKESKFTRINKVQAEILGLEKPEDAVGLTDLDFFAPDHASEAFADEKEIIRTGKPLVAKPEYIRLADGTFKWVSASKAPYVNSEGKITGIMGISRDISAERLANQKLAENEALLAGVIDGMTDLIIIRDNSLIPVRLNQAAQKFFGIDLKTESYSNIDKISGILFNPCNAKTALESGVTQIKEITDSLGGKTYECRTIPVRNESDEIFLIVEQIRDITDKKRVINELEDNQKRLNSLIDNIPVGIVLKKAGSLYLNNKSLEITGLESSRTIGIEDFFEQVTGFNSGQARIRVDELKYNEGLALMECKNLSGQKFFAEVNVFDGPDGEVWLFNDVSEKLKSDIELKKLYDRFVNITSQLPGMVYQFEMKSDGTYYIPYSNGFITNIFGFSLDEINGNPDYIFKNVFQDDLPGLIDSIRVSAETMSPWVAEFRLKSADGKVKWIRGNSTPQKDKDGSVLWHGFMTDITYDKKVEKEIISAHENLAATLKAIPDLLFEVDDKGLIYSYHAPSDNLLYQAPDSFIKRKVTEILPETASLPIMEAIMEASQKGFSTGVQYLLEDNGSPRWFELSISFKEHTAEGKRFISLVRDITSRKLTEIKLEHQSRVLEGVSRATTALLLEDDTHMAINQALEYIGNASGVDRVYLFEYHGDGVDSENNFISQRYEWCSPGTSPQIDNPDLQYVPADFIPRWNELLGAGKPVVGFVRDFPENEREILEPQEIISLLVVPVFVENRLFGFVGFDDCTKAYAWTQSEVFILQSLASGIGNALLRERAAEKLKFSENRFRVLYEESPIGLMLSEYDGAIINTNEAFRKILSCENPVPLQRNFNELIPENFRPVMDVALSDLDKTGRAGPIEIRLNTKKGGTIPVLMNLMVVKDLDLRPKVWAIIEDISERKKFEYELIKARDEATRANKSKSEFLANMSHEIRTPLNAIMGFAELLGDQLENPRHQEFVDIIGKSGRNLLLIINDILDLSRIEAGRMKIEPEPVKPQQIINELERIFSLSASEKKLKFIVDKDKDLPETLIMDETRVRQVLFNLLGNAIKFTHTGEVKLLVKTQNLNTLSMTCDLVLEVSDTGIGIPSEQQELIFMAFRQQEGQSTRKFGGTGLGLTITKRMVEMMNGQISVQSKPGEGSVFSVLLREVSIGQTYTPISISEDIELAKAFLFNHQTVLLVEDIQLNRAVIKEMFRGKNLILLEAVNGVEALEICRKNKPDLILMDMQMPVMDGYTATRLIKADKDLFSIPVVALTASAMKNEAEEIKKLCDGYLQKPVSPGVLMSELARFLTYNKSDQMPESQMNNDKLQPVGKGFSEEAYPNADLKNELLRNLKRIKQGMIIDEIIDFSHKVAIAGNNCGSGTLVRYADTLKKQAESFSIDLLMNSFDELETFLSNTEK